MARLGDICKINMGQSPDSSTYNDQGVGLPFYQGNADFGEVYPNARVYCSNPVKVAQKGDILISVRAPIGALNIARERCCIGRGLAAITTNEEKCCLQYLWHALLSKVDELNAKGTGSTFKAINRNILDETEIPLPSIEEQRTITAKLDKVYGLISLRKKQLQKLDDLIKSRFVEMFGDPVTNPKGWKKKALADEAEIKIGPFGSLLHKEDYISGGHALINPSHIIAGKISLDDNLTLTDEKYEELASYHLFPGDVVMGRRGEMGRCAVVEQSGLLCGTGSLIIRSNGELRADYIQRIISFPSFRKTIEEMAVGQTMPNLNVPIVSAFQIIKPPKEVQDQYFVFVKKNEQSKIIIQQGLDKLEQMKRALMQKYFG